MEKERFYLNNKYSFIKKYHKLEYLIHDNSVMDLIDEIENIQDKFKENVFCIDRFPRKIDSSLFFEWFDVYFSLDNSNEDNEKYYEVENHFLKVIKILSIYSSIWLETSYGYNPEGIPEEVLTEEDKELLNSVKGQEIFQVQSIELYTLFLKLSLKGYINSIVYLPELEVILSINDLFVQVIAFENQSLFETVCQTEGVYFRKI